MEWLAGYDQGRYCPEKCDIYEPLKVKFDASNLSEPMRWLSQPAAQFLFKRGRPVPMEGNLRNRRFAEIRVSNGRKGESTVRPPRVPEPIFLSVWTVWIGTAAVQKFGLDSLRAFMTGAFDVAQADYAFLASEADYRRKNFSVTREGNSTVEQFVGDEPQRGLPGLYWMNLFGPAYTEWFGRPTLKSLDATRVEDRGPRGFILEFGASPLDASPQVDGLQSAGISRLGADAFFDIGAPGRTLRVPDFLASMAGAGR